MDLWLIITLQQAQLFVHPLYVQYDELSGVSHRQRTDLYTLGEGQR
jgi:hypothetical protein